MLVRGGGLHGLSTHTTHRNYCRNRKSWGSPRRAACILEVFQGESLVTQGASEIPRSSGHTGTQHVRSVISGTWTPSPAGRPD